MAREDPQFRIRLPAALKDRVEKAASHDGRSINAEIVRRLEQSFDEQDRSLDPVVETLVRKVEEAIAVRLSEKD